MRVCVICDASLADLRADARHCSGACRAEASRLKGILSGNQPDGYRSIRDRLAAPRKRTRRDPADLSSVQDEKGGESR
jgi:hypothetical protein